MVLSIFSDRLVTFLLHLHLTSDETVRSVSNKFLLYLKEISTSILSMNLINLFHSLFLKCFYTYVFMYLCTYKIVLELEFSLNFKIQWAILEIRGTPPKKTSICLVKNLGIPWLKTYK